MKQGITTSGRNSGLLFLVLLFLTHTGLAQNYTWMHGNTNGFNITSFGAPGVPSAFNKPGSRANSATWKDAAGNLWLFGGNFYVPGHQDTLNDLWKYNISTNQWTWMHGNIPSKQPGVYGTKGVASSSNTPGARMNPMYWTDASGNFWLFGGLGYDAFKKHGPLNDLWKYSVSTNQWTWMNGSNSVSQVCTHGTKGMPGAVNTPGAAWGGLGWTDASGDLWLFGGAGLGATTPLALLNDLWKYNIATNQWTWVNGTLQGGQLGNYGTMGIASPNTAPGGRFHSCGWADASGNLWLMGGSGYDASSNFFNDAMNDLWKYNISTGEWTWIKGSNTYAPGSTFGTMGVPAPSNVPGGKESAVSWRDAATGDFYLFGGTTYAIANNPSTMGEMNDLWKYSPATNEWTWLKGGQSLFQNGIYGTQGTPSVTNRPGSRTEAMSWVDNSNNLWLFGGFGSQAKPWPSQFLNDLWKISVCYSTPGISISSSSSLACVGETITLTPAGGSLYSWGTSTVQTNSGISLTLSANSTFSTVGTNSAGCIGHGSYTQLVAPPVTASIVSVVGKTTLCPGDTVIVTAAGADFHFWSNNNSIGGPVTVLTSTVPGPTVFTCSIYSMLGCQGNPLTFTLDINPSPSPTITSSKSKLCRGEVVTLTSSGASSYSWHTTPIRTTAAIAVLPTVTTTYSITGISNKGCAGSSAFTQSVSACTDINDPSSEVLFSLYPNPNAGSFSIRSSAFKENTQLLLFNSIGQEVRSYVLLSELTNFQTGLQQGIYHYRIRQDGDQIISGKLVIE